MMRVYLWAVLAFFCLGTTAQAQGLRYADDERFAVVNEDAYNDLNVVLQEVTYDKLPPFIQGQLATIAHKCTGNNDNAYRTKVYGYVSENHRRRKLPPSFILDFSPLIKEPMTRCGFPLPCIKGQCHLVGYSAISAEEWSRSFAVLMQGWEVHQRPYPGTSLPQTFFRVRTQLEDCAARGGAVTDDEDDACRMDYVWNGGSLAVLQAGAQGQDEPGK